MSRITTLILAGTAFILLAGCANIDARREQRWAAFEPLRPDPEFRILPDRPLLKFEGARPQPAELPEVQSSEAPVIWEAKNLLKEGIRSSTSKFHAPTFEIYLKAEQPLVGELVAYALNSRMEEIGRARTEVNLHAGDAGLVKFTFPDELPETEVRVIVFDRAR